jgi:hypothetical protein
MKKTKVVVFDAQGGWVLINPEKSEYIDLPHAINPDLKAVAGLPPEVWDLRLGQVVPKDTLKPSFFEKLFRIVRKIRSYLQW